MISEKLLALHASENIADDLSDEELQKIGMRVCREFQVDEDSRSEWLKAMEDAIKIAKQVLEEKTTPWPGAANVKYPLITSSIISFASRTYPEIVRGDKVVLVGVIGPDPTGEKEAIAKRLSDHMSYQLLVESPNWEEDTDKLLMILPLMGLVYRKSYLDPFLKIPATDLCLPDRITVNNHIKTIETARRITHQLDMYNNDLLERMRMGIYREVDLNKLKENDTESDANEEDQDVVHRILEQHRYLDLDDDGYEEPYIVTVHEGSQEVLRIKARWDLENVIFNAKGKLAKIIPNCYFTDYHFIPNPDGTFHSFGYGTLLYPINETINTTINQLLDASTLQNTGGGFIGESVRMRGGVYTFKPGQWTKVTIAGGADIKSNIVPLPTPQPSPVSFQLLTSMIAAGKDLASVTDILQGQERAQNAPATTVLALIKEGLKVHRAIIKRLYRSLKKEFEKLVQLNRRYLDDQAYFLAFDGEAYIRKEDYDNETLRVFPIADPNLSSEAERMARAQSLMQIATAPGVDGREIMRRYLEALEVPSIDKVLPPPDPNATPPPEVLKINAEIDLLKGKLADLLMGRELEALKLEQADQDRQGRMAEAAARVADMKGKTIERFAKLEQEGAHFAIEKATADVAAEEQLTPPDQQINYTPVTAQELMAQMNGGNQQQQPPQQLPPEEMPMQDVPPELVQAISQGQGEMPQ